MKHVGKRGMNETRVGVGCRGLHRFLKCPQCLFIVISEHMT